MIITEQRFTFSERKKPEAKGARMVWLTIPVCVSISTHEHDVSV